MTSQLVDLDAALVTITVGELLSLATALQGRADDEEIALCCLQSDAGYGLHAINRADPAAPPRPMFIPAAPDVAANDA